MNKEDLKYKEYRRDPEDSDSGQEEADRLDRLVRDGEWEDLKHNKRYQELSTEGKIIKALDAVKMRESAVNKMYYEELADKPANSSVIYNKSLVPLRNLQRALRARYVGELDPKESPQEEMLTLDIPITNRPKLDKAAFKKAA